MSLQRFRSAILCCALIFVPASLFSTPPGGAPPAPSDGANSKAGDEVLKANSDCNAAELRADVAAMDACETHDFTHTHASGQVEHKAEYLQGVGSGPHKFLTLDLSDLHVRSYGDSAIVECQIHLRTDNGGKIADVNNQLMTVWVKEKGRWREAAWFAVGLPQSRTAAAAPDSK
jgi:ketosteroid isomerase-like protein